MRHNENRIIRDAPTYCGDVFEQKFLDGIGRRQRRRFFHKELLVPEIFFAVSGCLFLLRFLFRPKVSILAPPAQQFVASELILSIKHFGS